MDDLWWYRRLAGTLAALGRRRPPRARARSVAFISPARFADDSIVGGGERTAWDLAAAMAELVPTRMISFGPERLSITRGPLAIEIYRPRRWIDDVTFDPLSFGFLRGLAAVDVVHCQQYQLAATQLAIVAGAALGKRVYVSDRGGCGHHVDPEVPVADCVTEFLPISRFSVSLLPPEGRMHVIRDGVNPRFMEAGDEQPCGGRVLYEHYRRALVTVLRDPGVNAGFWDVPNRPLTGGPGCYAVAGVALRCFHFSGFDPDRSDLLSAHQNRVDLAEHPVLARLVSDYAAELHAAGHAAMAAQRPAGITTLARRLYREGRAAGELRRPLTSRAGEAELAAWLAEPADSGAWAGLTRYHLAFYVSSPELRSQYPDLDGPGALAYAEWLRATADRHPDLPAAVVPAAIEVDGRQLEPLLLTLFRARAEPLADFLAWLAEPAPQGGEAGATRYLHELHRFRPDLRAAFPVVGAELVAWARQTGRHEHPLLGELLYASPERAGAGSFA